MVAISFPSSPNSGDEHTVGGTTFMWDGTAWKRVEAETPTLDEESVEDTVGGLITAGDNVSVDYDDAAGTLTINATGVPTQEQVEDWVAGVITAGTNITTVYNDAAGTLTINSTATGGGGGPSISTIWASIPLNTNIPVGHIVLHGGAIFACITAHARSSTGPDGDTTNWAILSNWRGTWTDAWYPTGAFVSRSGSPYVASQDIVRGDPAPDNAANTKWLQLGGGTGGLDQNAVDARVRAVANQAYINGLDVTAEDVNNQRTGGNDIKFWTGTEAQYDAITTKDSDTVYLRTA